MYKKRNNCNKMDSNIKLKNNKKTKKVFDKCEAFYYNENNKEQRKKISGTGRQSVHK